MEILVSSYGDRGVPHMQEILRSNPGEPVHVSSEGVRGRRPGLDAWRNADLIIRDWWRDNGYVVRSERLAIVEWDVLVRQHFETAGAPEDAGLSGRHPKEWGGSLWQWWNEVDRLPEDIRRHRTGLAPLGSIIMSRAALDAVADPRWDHVFSLDIFCELRLPTVVRACGFKIGRVPAFDNCSHATIPDPGDRPGFYHPIKTPTK